MGPHSAHRTRERFRPHLEVLEDRNLCAVTGAALVGGVLTITCNADPDRIEIFDNGTNTGLGDVQVLADGVPVSFAPGLINTISVTTAGGKDEVIYKMNQPFQPFLARGVTVNLGADKDKFTANLLSFGQSADLTLAVFGGAARDTFTVNAVGANLDVNAKLTLNLNGGALSDKMTIDYQGALAGGSLLTISPKGNAGADTIDVTAKTDGSTGGTLVAEVFGGLGDDELSLDAPFPAPPGALAALTATASGGLGDDDCDGSSTNTVRVSCS